MYWEGVADCTTRVLIPRSRPAFSRPTYARWLKPRSLRPPMSVLRPTLKPLLEVVVGGAVVVPDDFFDEPQPAAVRASAATRVRVASVFTRLSGGFRLWDENRGRFYFARRRRRGPAGARVPARGAACRRRVAFGAAGPRRAARGGARPGRRGRGAGASRAARDAPAYRPDAGHGVPRPPAPGRLARRRLGAGTRGARARL